MKKIEDRKILDFRKNVSVSSLRTKHTSFADCLLFHEDISKYLKEIFGKQTTTVNFSYRNRIWAIEFQGCIFQIMVSKEGTAYEYLDSTGEGYFSLHGNNQFREVVNSFFGELKEKLLFIPELKEKYENWKELYK